MNLTDFNHLCGYVLLVSFFLCVLNVGGYKIHNLFVTVFWLSLLVWGTTGLYLMVG